MRPRPPDQAEVGGTTFTEQPARRDPSLETFDLPILGAEQCDPSAAGGSAVSADDEEGNSGNRVGTRGMLRCYDGCQSGASSSIRSTITQSRQAPSSFPCRR